MAQYGYSAGYQGGGPSAVPSGFIEAYAQSGRNIGAGIQQIKVSLYTFLIVIQKIYLDHLHQQLVMLLLLLNQILLLKVVQTLILIIKSVEGR